MTNVDVLGAVVVHRILGEQYSGVVIVENWERVGESISQIL